MDVAAPRLGNFQQECCANAPNLEKFNMTGHSLFTYIGVFGIVLDGHQNNVTGVPHQFIGSVVVRVRGKNLSLC